MSSSLRRGSMTSSMTSLRSQPALPPKPTNIQIKKTSGGSYKVSGGGLKSPSSGGGGSLKNVGSKATLSKPSSPKVNLIVASLIFNFRLKRKKKKNGEWIFF